MNTTIWIFQGLMAIIFFYSGYNKAWFDAAVLVAKGQTGVEGLPGWFIKFIGIAELLGAVALIAPGVFNKYVFLIPVAAVCLGAIMIPAAIVHFRRNEMRNVVLNIAILIICVLIAFYRY